MTARSIWLLGAAALLAVTGSVVVWATSGAGAEAGGDAASESRAAAAPSISSGSTLAPHRVELLDWAFQAASAMPTRPHVKNRCRAQEDVVIASLELDQADRAVGYAGAIENWRGGSALARCALHLARAGANASVVEPLLVRAQELNGKLGPEEQQEWQRDRTRVTVALAYLALGMKEKADESAAGEIVETEKPELIAARSATLDPAAFDEMSKQLEQAASHGTLEQVQGALETYALLFDRHYSAKDRRSSAEEAIKRHRNKLPIVLAIGLFESLAKSAIDHGDAEAATRLISETQAVVDQGQWRAEDKAPILARMALLRFRAGEKEAARSLVDSALATFEAEKALTYDVFRAEALRPLAEAYRAMGDGAAALDVYRRAIEEGAKNPNARPRAQDLIATSLSMAVHDVAPDAKLRARMLEILGGLGDPW